MNPTAFTEVQETLTALQALVLHSISPGGSSVEQIASEAGLHQGARTARNVLAWLAAKQLVTHEDGLWRRTEAETVPPPGRRTRVNHGRRNAAQGFPSGWRLG